MYIFELKIYTDGGNRELTLALPPIPAFKFRQIPISYGNSCFWIRILMPSGPSRKPPRALARRTSVRCRDISHPSIVVVFSKSIHRVRMRRMESAKRVSEFTTRSTKRWMSCARLGPRYCLCVSTVGSTSAKRYFI